MGRQLLLDVNRELIVDLFAGGGGASEGIYQALGRHVDVAINHDTTAIALHTLNHRQTQHLREDIFHADPIAVAAGRPVGLLWASPDCRHFSRAKGGRPVQKNIRSLPWVVLKWAGKVAPRVICLENVAEVSAWGRLVATRDKATGRVLRADGSVAPAGERTPLRDQQLTPDTSRAGTHFQRLLTELRRMGYAVEWRELVASDYGVPTKRKRLFLIARNDSQPIQWPTITHGDPRSLKTQAGRLKPWRTAAECIDFSAPCPSVFLTKEEGRAIGVKRPLAPATMARVAKGVLRYVVQTDKPFIVADDRGGVSGASLITVGYGERKGQSPRVPAVDAPLGTVVAGGGKHALVTALMLKHYGGVVGFPVAEPLHTVTSRDHHALVLAKLERADDTLQASSIMKMRGTNIGHPTGEPLHTVSAQGTHFAEVRTLLTRCAERPIAGDPALVSYKGENYLISDIGMRMLAPRDLSRAMSFPDTYAIGDDPRQGLTLTKEQQVRMIGNSVPPLLVKQIVYANCAEIAIRKAA